MSTQFAPHSMGPGPSGIRLGEILPESRVIGSTSVTVTSCCGRWDECQPQDLYVAIMDAEHDGHDYVAEAVERGAKAIVTERYLATKVPQFIVEDTRQAYGQICQALVGLPSQRLTTIGVSGTDGKTITTHLIRSILRAAELEAGLVSSIENGVETDGPNTMNAPLIANQLAHMVLGGCTHGVVEMPSIALARHAMSGVSLDVAVLTNIRQDHMQFHGSKENYLNAKTRVLDFLKPTGFAVMNADDPTTHFLLDKIDTPTLTIGIKQEAEVTARVIESNSMDQSFLISAGTETVAVRSTMIGLQHVYNSLTAAAVALTMGIDLSTIARGIESCSSIPGRLERVDCGQDFGVWIDSARSPGQLANAIQAIRKVTKGKVWCIGSIDENQSANQRHRMGEILDRAADKSVITRADVIQIADFEPAHQFLDGYRKPGTAQLIPDRFEAINWTLAQAKPGDSVLVTGCGERAFARLSDEWTVSDRHVCEVWLYDQSGLGQTNAVEFDAHDIYRIDDYRD